MCVCVFKRWRVRSDADLFTSARDPRQAVAVPQGELDFDVDALRSFAANVACPQPVVLIGLHDVAHLVRPHWGIPLIHHADLLPLRMRHKEVDTKKIVVYFTWIGLRIVHFFHIWKKGREERK